MLETTDQYMMGPSILVAPVFTRQTSRKIIFPKGNWYDFYTGKFVVNGKTITIQTKLEQIPLFVKDGGTIPMMPPVNNIASAKGPIELEVRHYGQKENTYLLYDDDGQTFDYEKGIFSITELRVRRKDGKLTGTSSTIENKWPSRYRQISWKFMSQ